MLPQSKLTEKQTKDFGPKFYAEHGQQYRITAHVRHDDQCRNGHNTFSITATIERKVKNHWEDDAGGCCHDEVAKHFPNLAPLLKWHLVSTDEPLHYIANTVYMAGDRNHNGLLKGEFRQYTSRGKYQADGIEGIPNWELKMPEGQPADVYSTEKPAPVTLEWKASGITGEGKARELDAARRAAVWPDAADEDLTAPGLVSRLQARLPALMAEFKAAVESLGFTY